jgi:DNA polymerase III epsilon subunit-like protein
MAKLLVIDTETGGIDPDRHSLLSIALVVWEDRTLKGELEVLLAEPELVVTAKALEINRIDLVSHSRQAVSPAKAMEIVVSFINEHFQREIARGEKVVLAGHNIGFDVGFLRRLCRLAGADFERLFSHRVLDTASILRFLSLAGRLPESAAISSNAFAAFNISFDDGERHTALGDAKATALLLTALVTLVSENDATRSIFVAA